MSIIESVEVLPAEPLPARILDVQLQRRKHGPADDLYCLFLVGKVVGEDRAPSRLVFMHEGLRLVTATGSVVPELRILKKNDTPGEVRFEAALNLIGLPAPHASLELMVSFEAQELVSVARIRIRRRALRPSYRPRFRQIPLHTIGRSGSTWFMRILARHPDILVENTYPYEFKGAQYYVDVLRALTQPVAESNLPMNRTLYKPNMACPNPYYHPAHLTVEEQSFFGSRFVESLADFCLRSIDELYTVIWRRQSAAGRRFLRRPPRLLLEKQVTFPALVNELYAHEKELFLFRDPRDIICSILAYQEKRGISIFGRPVSFTDEQFLETILTAFRDHWTGWSSRRHTAQCVRYEQLISRPEATLKDLFEYLEIDASQGVIARLMTSASQSSEKLSSHQTSATPGESQGRWRTEMPLDVQEFCWSRAHDVLTALGYSERATSSA